MWTKLSLVVAFIALTTVSGQPTTQYPNAVACPGCEHAVSLIKNHTDVTKIEDLVHVLCHFSSDVYKCDSTAIAKIEDLWALSPKEICKATHVCYLEDSAEKYIGCPTCQYGVALAKLIASNEPVREGIHSLISVLCHFSGEGCTRKMEEKVDTILNATASVSMSAACQKAHMCNKHELFETAELDGAFTCPMCKYFMKKTKMLIIQNKTDTEIIESAQKVCVMFRTHKNVCLNFVKSKMESMLKVVRYMDETEMCQKMNMCDAPKNALLTGSNDLCTFATEEGQALQSVLADSSNIKPIIDTIKESCSKTGLFSNVCSNLVTGLVMKAVESIVKADIPLLLKHLHICP